MFELKNKATTLHVNHLGFIESVSVNSLQMSVSAYLVFFQDYSRVNPFCRLWDVESQITDCLEGDRWLEYTKKIEEICFECRVEAKENGWDWELEIRGSYPLHHRFGLAIPCSSNDFHSLNRPITSVSQYTKGASLIPVDQTLLEFPIVSSENKTTISVFGALEFDYQFFVYSDNAQNYIRMTTTTSLANHMEISCRWHQSSSSHVFLEKHPSADHHLNKWKSHLDKINEQQGIIIMFQDKQSVIKRGDLKIELTQFKEEKLIDFCPIFKIELMKYPSKFLHSIGVDSVVLCGNIVIKDKNVIEAGATTLAKSKELRKWILYDVSQRDPKIIHHEIFHFISDQLDLTENINQSINIEERSADLFADVMVGDCFDETVRKKIKMFNPSIRLPDRECTFEAPQMIWWKHDDIKEQIVFGEMPFQRTGKFYVE